MGKVRSILARAPKELCWTTDPCAAVLPPKRAPKEGGRRCGAGLQDTANEGFRPFEASKRPKSAGRGTRAARERQASFEATGSPPRVSARRWADVACHQRTRVAARIDRRVARQRMYETPHMAPFEAIAGAVQCVVACWQTGAGSRPRPVSFLGALCVVDARCTKR